MWVLTVFPDTYSSPAISGAVRLVGRWRSMRSSLSRSGSASGAADGDVSPRPASRLRLSAIMAAWVVSAWEGLLGDESLASRFRLIAFDLRGHGRSDTALKPGQLVAEGPEAGARLWSLDLDAVLAGVESPILVGWSFGSGVIQSWLYTHQDGGGAAAAVLASAPKTMLRRSPKPPGRTP